MPYAENGLWYDEGPQGVPGGGGGGASGGTGTPDPYYAPPTPGENFNPFFDPYFVPGAAPAPSGGGGGAPPPPVPEPQQPPPIGFDPTPAPFVDSGPQWLGGAMWNPFGSRILRGRTVRYPSPFRQAVTEAIRGARDYFRTRPVGPPRPPPPPPEILFRFLGPGQWGVLPTILGRASGVLAGLWPNPALQELPLSDRERLIGSERELLDVFERARKLPVITEQFPLGPPRTDRPLDQVPDFAPKVADDYIPQDRSPNPFVELGLELLRQNLPAPLRHYVDDFAMGPPKPAQRSSPATTAPVPQVQVPSTAPRSSSGPRTRRNAIFTFGTLGTLALLIEANRSGSRASQTSPAPTSPPTLNPAIPVPTIPSPEPNPSAPTVPGLTPFNLGVGSYGGYGVDACDCETKRRGPRRKCLQRAGVKWTGGPRKGKAAGTKCIRFAGRKT